MITLDEDILEFSLYSLKMIGEHMHFTSKKLQIWRLFNIFALIIALWSTVLKLGHSTGIEYMRVIEGISIIVHVSSAVLFCVLKHQKLIMFYLVYIF